MELAIGIGIVTLVGVGLFFWVLKGKQDELERNFKRRFSGRAVRKLDKHAVLRALESDGYSQRQGMGYLVLTDDELVFERTMLEILLRIPVQSIVSVRQGSRLKGVGLLRPMLLVEFKLVGKPRDTLGVSVRDLDDWQSAIEQAVADAGR